MLEDEDASASDLKNLSGPGEAGTGRKNPGKRASGKQEEPARAEGSGKPVAGKQKQPGQAAGDRALEERERRYLEAGN